MLPLSDFICFRERMKGHLFGWLKKGNKVIEYRDFGENVILSQIDLLAARLFKNEGIAGVTHFAVGTGAVTWDEDDPPDPDVEQEYIVGELYRKAISSTSYIDDEGNVSVDPTTIVEFTTTFMEDEAVGKLMTCGLIGGPDAATPGKGIFINVKNFKAWPKTSDVKLTLTWRVKF